MDLEKGLKIHSADLDFIEKATGGIETVHSCVGCAIHGLYLS